MSVGDPSSRPSLRPPVEPLSELAHARIERRVLEALAADDAEAPARSSARGWVPWAVGVALAAAAIGLIVASQGDGSAPPAVATVADGGGQVASQRVATTKTESSVSFADAELALAPWTTVLLVGNADSGPLVVLERGSAEFSVSSRGARPPLVVNAGAVRVTVVGTRFMVVRSGDAAAVDVRHGTVDILYQGQTSRVTEGGSWRPSSGGRGGGGPGEVPAAGSDELPAPPPAGDPIGAVVIDAGVLVADAPPAPASSGATAVLVRDAAPMLTRAERFNQAIADEASKPMRALAEYRALARGNDAWAANACFAAARLLHERGEVAGARRMADDYLRRFAQGANASDARELHRFDQSGRRAACSLRSQESHAMKALHTGKAVFFMAVALVACGDGNSTDGTDGTDGTDAVVVDADPNAIDANPNAVDANTTPCGPTECNNCLDDDADGQVDGDDIECTGVEDDDEGSFATDIPGDNMDSYTQDCFYDGNSGGNAGNDCIRHTCCFSDATNQDECDAFLLSIGVNDAGPNFDVAECANAVTDGCVEHCDAVTPPGCDCFGCCTVCDPDTDECFDINTNPIVAPDCDADVIGNPDLCPRCDKVAECGTDCQIENCILCPGQTEEDLPIECKAAVCPAGLTACESTLDCVSGDYCSNGCCIPQID